MGVHVLQVERTYTGPQTGSEDVVEHMKSCNPRGPLIIQVAKLFPKSDVSSFGEAPSLEGAACLASLAWHRLIISSEQATQAVASRAVLFRPSPLSCTTDTCMHSCTCLPAVSSLVHH